MLHNGSYGTLDENCIKKICEFFFDRFWLKENLNDYLCINCSSVSGQLNVFIAMQAMIKIIIIKFK